MDPDDRWLDLAASLALDADEETRAQAHDLFLAEAARCRLVDRSGWAHIWLRCGRTLDGALAPGPDGIDGHVTVRHRDGPEHYVPVASVVAVSGSRPALRPEPDLPRRSLTSWLRDCWQAGDRLSCLTADGRWLGGRVTFVGSDHVELAEAGTTWLLPFAAVDAWTAR